MMSDAQYWQEEYLKWQKDKDIVTVVRCKDCKHFMEFEKPLGKWQGLCHYYNAHSVMKNDFCSRANKNENH